MKTIKRVFISVIALMLTGYGDEVVICNNPQKDGISLGIDSISLNKNDILDTDGHIFLMTDYALLYCEE